LWVCAGQELEGDDPLGAAAEEDSEGEEGEQQEDSYGGYAMLGDGDDVAAAQDESGGEDDYGGYAPLGTGDDDNDSASASSVRALARPMHHARVRAC
jgi:hypothetical protein